MPERHARRHRVADNSDFAKMGASLVLLGPLLVMAFGRWGSYLKIPGVPIYLSDLFFFAGSACLAGAAITGRHELQLRTHANRMVLTASVAAGGAAVMGLWSASSYSILAIRDAAPFIYIALVPVFSISISVIGTVRVLNWMLIAGILHTLWIVPAMIDVLSPTHVPIIGGAPAFTIRHDYDLLICGLTVILAATADSLTGTTKAVLVVANLGTLFLSGSRAGLIAGIVVVFVSAIALRPFSDPKRGPMRLCATMIGFATLILAAIYVRDDPPSWALGMQKLVPNDSSMYQSGQNTWNARVRAWEAIWLYTNQGGGLSMSGFGFGANPVMNSGAIAYLSGDPSVRAAHSFIFTWYAFVGAIGVAAIVTSLAVFAFVAIRNKSFMTQRSVSVGRALMIGVTVAGLAGVILESPFGYLTLAIGIALGVTCDSRKADDTSSAAGTPVIDERAARRSSPRSDISAPRPKGATGRCQVAQA